MTSTSSSVHFLLPPEEEIVCLEIRNDSPHTFFVCPWRCRKAPWHTNSRKSDITLSGQMSRMIPTSEPPMCNTRKAVKADIGEISFSPQDLQKRKAVNCLMELKNSTSLILGI